LTCEKCSYEALDVHRTGYFLITYCQQCGDETKVKRTEPRQRWTDEQRTLRREDLHVIQGGKKKKKKRRR
jgi:hypothetical protein